MQNLPYYKQETSWTCGAAVMRMVLESFGVKRSEKQLSKVLETNKIVGTWEYEIPRLAEKYRLDYFVERNGKLSDLRNLLKKGFIPIVCYYIIREKTAHFSIVRKINNEFIYLHDPWFGPDHKLKISYFRKVWKSDPVHEKDKRWFIAVKNNK